jgi:hypothetical protein
MTNEEIREMADRMNHSTENPDMGFTQGRRQDQMDFSGDVCAVILAIFASAAFAGIVGSVLGWWLV